MAEYFKYESSVKFEKNMIIPLIISKSFGPIVLVFQTSMTRNDFTSLICERFARSYFLKGPISSYPSYGKKSNGIFDFNGGYSRNLYFFCIFNSGQSVHSSQCKVRLQYSGYISMSFYFFCGNKRKDG